jgi:hypothetical protein
MSMYSFLEQLHHITHGTPPSLQLATVSIKIINRQDNNVN